MCAARRLLRPGGEDSEGNPRLTQAMHDRVSERAADLPEEGCLVELGCGAGVLALSLSELRADIRIHGIDTSTDHIRIAKDATFEAGVGDRVHFDRAELGTLPLSNGAADMTVAVGTLSSFPSPQVLLSEVSRILDHGGMALFYEDVAPRGGRRKVNPGLHRSARDEDALRAYVMRSPLKDEAEFNRIPFEDGSFLEIVLAHAVPREERQGASWRFSAPDDD